jgi:hypothetical protein
MQNIKMSKMSSEGEVESTVHHRKGGGQVRTGSDKKVPTRGCPMGKEMVTEML